MVKQTDSLKKEFQYYLQDITQKNLLITAGLGVLVLFYFVYSDIVIRNNLYALYTRLLPIGIGVPLLVLQIFTKEKFKRLKLIMYNALFVGLLIMMYAKYLVYLNDEGAVNSVTGIILIIFLTSLDLKTNTLNTVLVYVLPTLAFVFLLVFFFDLTEDETVNISNIYPMVLLGFTVNRIQYKLRFRLFKANYLLKKEKQKTKELYEESLVMNEHLQQNNEEIKLQKDSIEEKNNKLQEYNATKDKFFSIISHDLKTPFNAMLGFSKILVNQFDVFDKAKQKRYVKNINQSVNITYRLLENLLIWARSQNETIELNLKSENLFQLAEEVIELFRQSADDKSIKLLNQINEEITIVVDKNIFTTILRNLISNAIKFTPKNGSIKLNATIISDSYTKISIEDSGVGIPPEKLSRLFNISERTSTKGTENEIGTGLGLIICKEFVEKHGGEIWVESEIDKGSTFIFTIPFG